jgi:hypothetical protein
MWATFTPTAFADFWSLLKRGIHGTTSASTLSSVRCVDEQAFSVQESPASWHAERFGFLVRKVVGTRLRYAELAGKVGEKPEEVEPF